MRQLLDALSRMSTAVTLLWVLALASVAGTILQQGQPLANYEARYGAFWTELFRQLGLMHVYGTWWFLLLGGFVALSTLVCLLRNGPRLLRQLRAPQRHLPGIAQLKTWSQHVVITAPEREAMYGQLSRYGFTRRQQYPDGSELWLRGRCGRLGYIFAHTGVLVLCLAGCLTAFVGFRGGVQLNDGAESNKAILSHSDGRLYEHQLPFSIRSDGFEVLYYGTGMPRSFMTHVTLLQQGRPVAKQLVEVNKPLRWHGYSIYQADFGDGGSRVTLHLRDIQSAQVLPPVDAKVHTLLTQPGQGYSIELDDFRTESVADLAPVPGQQNKPTNLGPSLDVIVRGPDMTPVKLRVFAERPWLIGLGDGRGKYEFAFLGLDPTKATGWGLVKDMLAGLRPGLTGNALEEALSQRLKQFAGHHLSGLPEEARLRYGIGAMMVATFLYQTRLPFMITLGTYDYHPYTGLMVTKDPGIYWFLLGAILLAAGVLMMLYLPFARVWIRPTKNGWLVAAQATKPGVLPELRNA